MTHSFSGEDARDNAYITPKYNEAKAKAIEMIDNGGFGLADGDFWVLKNKTKNGGMLYTSLIISHNGCLKVNDRMPDEKRFKAECVQMDKDGYGGSLVFSYICPEQGLYEVGEFSGANGKNAYPYAMALKRMFDRVVLKLSKLAYSGVMSEVESDEFKRDFDTQPQPTAPPPAVPCTDCDKPIVSVKKRDGIMWEVEDMIKYSSGRFGRPLCSDCMKRVQKEETAAEKERQRLEKMKAVAEYDPNAQG